MKSLPHAVLLFLGLSAAAQAADTLPAGFYLYRGNDSGNYRPADEPDAIPLPRSPSIHAERNVCIPADSQAWLQEQIRRRTTGLYPQGRFAERQTAQGRVYTLLNPAQAKPGLDAYTVGMALKNDPQGRPSVYFSTTFTDTERNSTYQTHINQWYDYQGKNCPADAGQE
ncbi:hypothetical protein H9Q10_04265 [Eikenella sp. S3360]|uniref:Uncharacterized protein n=1 Tax=Eikenella glucosivorans TaxID=2766967 RepID=A0ABS0N9A9_9NEIS|nr:hypothetical protein [Eikenella glucosivorans]MBH5328879.1 hypothetical protein [Eikenella glucosivorans]